MCRQACACAHVSAWVRMRADIPVCMCEETVNRVRLDPCRLVSETLLFLAVLAHLGVLVAKRAMSSPPTSSVAPPATTADAPAASSSFSETTPILTAVRVAVQEEFQALLARAGLRGEASAAAGDVSRPVPVSGSFSSTGGEKAYKY